MRSQPKKLKIYYVGPVVHGSLSAQRAMIMKRLGHSVTIQNIAIRVGQNKNQLKNRLLAKLKLAQHRKKLNAQIISAIKNDNFNILWVDKGLDILPSTLHEVRLNNPNVKIVNFNPDNPFGSKATGWKNHINSIPYFNIVFVPRDRNIAEYKEHNAQHVSRFYWGYTPEIHMPLYISSELKNRIGGSVGFIGSYEKQRFDYLLYAAQNGIRIRVWGGGWSKYRLKSKNLIIENRELWGGYFTKGINSFDVNLCFLNKANFDTFNTRCVVIPACRSVMLCERTKDTTKYFKDNSEAMLFDSKDEFLSKLQYLTQNHAARDNMKNNAYNRCQKDKYSNYHLIINLLNQVNKN
ncbi:MAG: glycosyltransferase [Desulfarculaceae bacterium]|nr:glycosyltransferase [Desulfarculaceae bacterium]